MGPLNLVAAPEQPARRMPQSPSHFIHWIVENFVTEDSPVPEMLVSAAGTSANENSEKIPLFADTNSVLSRSQFTDYAEELKNQPTIHGISLAFLSFACSFKSLRKTWSFFRKLSNHGIASKAVNESHFFDDFC